MELQTLVLAEDYPLDRSTSIKQALGQAVDLWQEWYKDTPEKYLWDALLAVRPLCRFLWAKIPLHWCTFRVQSIMELRLLADMVCRPLSV